MDIKIAAMQYFVDAPLAAITVSSVDVYMK